MNPQATWEQLLAAFAAGDWDVIEQRATQLIEWLDRGGFPPKVLNRPDLGLDWDRTLARAGCLFALDTMQDEWSIPCGLFPVTSTSACTRAAENQEAKRRSRQ